MGQICRRSAILGIRRTFGRPERTVSPPRACRCRRAAAARIGPKWPRCSSAGWRKRLVRRPIFDSIRFNLRLNREKCVR